jgi:pimeloyl-ACP methyl ester carboxylesterase
MSQQRHPEGTRIDGPTVAAEEWRGNGRCILLPPVAWKTPAGEPGTRSDQSDLHRPDTGLRDLLLPLLRADVEMHENYKPVSDARIRTPVTSLRGREDALVSAAEAGQWRDVTSGDFQLVELPGEHMYLADSPLPLLEAVSRAVQE